VICIEDLAVDQYQVWTFNLLSSTLFLSLSPQPLFIHSMINGQHKSHWQDFHLLVAEKINKPEYLIYKQNCMKNADFAHILSLFYLDLKCPSKSKLFDSVSLVSTMYLFFFTLSKNCCFGHPLV